MGTSFDEHSDVDPDVGVDMDMDVNVDEDKSVGVNVDVDTDLESDIFFWFCAKSAERRREEREMFVSPAKKWGKRGNRTLVSRATTERTTDCAIFPNRDVLRTKGSVELGKGKDGKKI